MSNTQKLILILGLTSSTTLIILLVAVFLFFFRRGGNGHNPKEREDLENKPGGDVGGEAQDEEDLVIFQGGQGLTIVDILEAPGEVIGKSNYGTLYKAFLQRSNCIRLLRFLRPVCTSRVKDFDDVMRLLGGVRHPNLVPLLGFYGGPRGEKLLVHPYFRRGNLAQFIKDGTVESHSWSVIYRISVGIVKGLDYLHTGFAKPIVHGNLKSKNILLERSYQPCISDFGMHLLLNPNTGQEMLESAAAEGYKALELIKMRDSNEETDVFSLGVILLELLSGKEPINENPTPDEDFYLPSFMRNAVLDRRISDLYHPDILLGNGDENDVPVTEERILRFFHLAMSCCSPSPSLRPKIKQVSCKLEEIGR